MKRVYATVRQAVTNSSGRVPLPKVDNPVQDGSDAAMIPWSRGLCYEVCITSVATAVMVGIAFGDVTVTAAIPAAGAQVSNDVIAAANTWVFYYSGNLKDTHIAAITDAGTCTLLISLVDTRNE